MRAFGHWPVGGLPCLALAGVLLCAGARPALADDYWHFQKKWTAQVVDAHRVAVETLQQAKRELQAAQRALNDARLALGAATAAAATQQAQMAVNIALNRVGIAQINVQAAARAAAATAAAAGAFDVGTGIGQGLGWGVSWVWDPILLFDAVDPVYRFPTDAEVDAMIPALLQTGMLATVPLTRQDFDEADEVTPGAGTASWSFVREGVRGFAIAMRGAAAHTAGRCEDVRTARDDLIAFLQTYPSTVHQYASVLSQIQTYSGAPRADLAAASESLDDLAALLDDFPNPQEVADAIQMVRDQIAVSIGGLDLASDSSGNPLRLDGPDGVFQPLTLSQFQQFLVSCSVSGVDALPQIEVAVLDGLMNWLEITWLEGSSIAESVAFWDGLGDLGDEAADFPPSGVLFASQVLTSGLSEHIARINLHETPLICIADFDCSGTVTIDDVFLFLNAWFADAAAADVDGLGGITVTDIFVFLKKWFAGCPN